METIDLVPKAYLIDDDPILLEVLKSLVESVGISPLLFRSAADFLQVYAQYPVECVVSDIRMPNLSGLQLQKILQDRFSVPPPIILVTGHAEISAAVEAMKHGAFDFVEKPIVGHQLIDKIQAAMALSQELHRKRVRIDVHDAQLALLTPKEREVLDAVVNGLSSKDIADNFGLSIRTVENHRARLMEKLRVKSVAELIKKFVIYTNKAQ